MLTHSSDQIADAVAAVAPAVVQVRGAARPASGLAWSDDHVVTMMRALGRDDRASIRRDDGSVLDGHLVGWDPATRLALLHVPDLGLRPLAPAAREPRVGHIAIAVARSWSNAVTATAGLISVIGGPLPTGRRQAIERVIRTSAPMHEGFAGGALVDTDGGLVGLATAGAIRGLGVVIPAPIAWSAAAAILEHGTVRRGYLGIAVQVVRVSERQAAVAGRADVVLVVAVTPGSPAADAGVLVGDVLLSLDGQALHAPDDLLELLQGERVGHAVELHVMRGEGLATVRAIVTERA